MKLESNASKLIVPANVSEESFPEGRKNSSNFAMAPAFLARSLACNTCVVDFQLGPRTCLATRRQAAVFPIPAGPQMSRCGGLALIDNDVNPSIACEENAMSEKNRGWNSSSQLDIQTCLVAEVFE